MWDFQLKKSDPEISMCVLHHPPKHGCTLQEIQPLHTQQDKIVRHHKHHITLWPGISLALRESLRCGGTRPFSTLKKPSNKCKTTRQRSFEKNSWVCFKGSMFDEFLGLRIIFHDSFPPLDFGVHVNKKTIFLSIWRSSNQKKTGLKIG